MRKSSLIQKDVTPIMEILAPCGSPEHIKAAIYAGADAVYLGGPGFNARRGAANFTMAQIRQAGDFCRGFGAKVYVTLNTLVRDGEWPELRAYIEELADAAPDALIVQDLGVAALCRQILPGMPLHASTQTSIHTVEGAAFCREIGFSRVVVARECDRATLTEMIEKSGIEIEVFVHGALCVSVSGQCGLSAMIGGRSGNRGMCAQPCRLDFSHGNQNFALSLKDLSLVRQVPLLGKMGVCSLKIEGRMKRPEYVAAAVAACRAASEGRAVDFEALQAVFSRGGFTQGYFEGRRTGMGGVRSAEDAAESAAILPRLAPLMRAPAKRVATDMRLTLIQNRPSQLWMSDGVNVAAVEGPMTQTRMGEKERQAADAVKSGKHQAQNAERGPGLDLASLAVRQLSRLGDTPFFARDIQVEADSELWISAAGLNGLRREAAEKLLTLRVRQATPQYCVQPQTPELNVKQPKGFSHSEASLRQTPVLRIHCRTVGQIFALAAAINQQEVRTNQPVATADQLVVSPAHFAVAMRAGISAQRVLVEADRYIVDEAVTEHRLYSLRQQGAMHLLCQNPAHVPIGKRLGYALHGGMGLNVFNGAAAEFWAAHGLRDLTASMELRLSQCLALGAPIPMGLAAYGRLPLMLLRRCPFENQGKCGCGDARECGDDGGTDDTCVGCQGYGGRDGKRENGGYPDEGKGGEDPVASRQGACPGWLSDRTERRFPVSCHGEFQELLNADVLWMADKCSAMHGMGFLSLLLFDETPEQARAVVEAYRQGVAASTEPSGKAAGRESEAAAPAAFTRGLLMRGVQ